MFAFTATFSAYTFRFWRSLRLNTPLLTAETTMSAKYTQRRAFKKQLVDLYP